MLPLFGILLTSIMVYLTDRFHLRGSLRLSRIQTRSTSRMSLPTSRYIWHLRRHRVHLSSISRQLPRVTSCHTLSHSRTMAAVPAWAVTLVTCQPQILSPKLSQKLLTYLLTVHSVYIQLTLAIQYWQSLSWTCGIVGTKHSCMLVISPGRNKLLPVQDLSIILHLGFTAVFLWINFIIVE